MTNEKLNDNHILSNQKFKDLEEINEQIKKALLKNGYEYMTKIQASCIPIILSGRDVLGSAKTGSGKTLAFVVPALDLLYRLEAKPILGTLALIIGPTRELVIQIFECVQSISEQFTFRKGCIYGGTNKNTEKENLIKGVNLLVATPGRLLDHMESCSEFYYKNLKYLVLDEADRLLDIGFEKALTKIINLLPKDRQTVLFSATQKKEVRGFIRTVLRNPIYVEVKETANTKSGLKQYYLMADGDIKLAILYKTLKERSDLVLSKTASLKSMKIMVFISSCQSVQFHEDLFRLFNNFLPIFSLHGQKKQAKRLETYNKFCIATKGILFCTNVAARGLHFPVVDLIIQYDPPEDPKDYIHRVGRTARGVSGTGISIIFLRPSEIKFIEILEELDMKLKRVEPKYKQINLIQEKLEKVVEITSDLRKDAIISFKKFLLAYASHSLKNIFNIEALNLLFVAKSFGLSEKPKVNLLGLTSLKKKV